MVKKSSKARLVEAGPGAGKTHTMADEIVAALRVLPPHRFLAAITYTNAAANTIRERLAIRTHYGPNVFVGTTHSFVSRFILAPYAELLSLLPEERFYAAINVHEKGPGAHCYTQNLINKGIVPFDAMIPIARKILAKSVMRDRICGRLAHIFVDEFQDTDTGMLEILDHFRKSGKTSLYVVGDSEQYVMSFTNRGRKSKTFDKIPFFKFGEKAEIESIVENHRSNGEIVGFANQFRKDVQQIPVKPYRKEPRVLFLPVTCLEEIVQRYQDLSANVEVEDGKQRTRLYLSEENATFDAVRDKFRLVSISNLGRKTYSLLGDALELMSTALDRSQRQICKEFGLSRLQWRAFGVRLLRELSTGGFGVEELVALVAKEFGHKVSKSRIKLVENGLDLLGGEVARGRPVQMTELCASIRKAKGLQADAALVVAKSVKEVKKWLQTDYSVRAADKQDKCRVGYVAFTRPREMLCIACLEEIDKELNKMLKDLGIVTVAGKIGRSGYVTSRRRDHPT